ncbi:MAG TPA: hypothetical protein VKA49_00710 [Flavitalea sp.]|nr:hypothetical protein [Flavitalea sp.]
MTWNFFICSGDRVKDQLHTTAPLKEQNMPVSYLQKFLQILQTGDTI